MAGLTTEPSNSKQADSHRRRLSLLRDADQGRAGRLHHQNRFDQDSDSDHFPAGVVKVTATATSMHAVPMTMDFMSCEIAKV
jgi:hypothetical protein